MTKTNTETNRKIVQEGLDRKAEAREAASQEAQEAQFLDKINQMALWELDKKKQIQAVQRRCKLHRKQEATKAANWNTFTNRTWIPVLSSAAVAALYTHQGIAAWVAVPFIALSAMFIVVNTVAYATRNRKEV